MQTDLFEKPLHFETHAAIIRAMEALTDDPLYPTGNRMVIYRGNPQADLLIVGEGPGANEDRLGKPYVGRSGQLLDKILEAAGFDSQNGVYVTNTVFRRPPDNRDPTQAELDFYLPYLLELIRIVDPKVILLTGRFSMRQILGEKRGITKVRGTWYQRHDRWIMPMFHPAYLLRNPSRAVGKPKSLTWQDIQAVRRKYDELGGDQSLLLKRN
ncbi:MAG TPA: uracil-DNA glycosylase [Anaerolineae bacterium]|nr:uracil-DNA glycosylase [Anaerolineae bacterium]